MRLLHRFRRKPKAPEAESVEEFERKYGLSWCCEVCGDRRPDALISVWSVPIPLGGGVVMTRNVKYCNDREECLHGAPAIARPETV